MIVKTFLTVLMIPAALSAQSDAHLGEFEDDYGESYSISQTHWSGPGSTTMEIVKWDDESRSLFLRNDPADQNYSGMWTRIDWMELEGMPPYEWAYCFTAFDAPSLQAAEAATPANRDTPRTGCGGFPFSRIKKK